MSANHHATGSDAVDTAQLRQLLIANAILAGIFALLVAASYTGVAAAVVSGTMATAGLGFGITRLADEGVSVPGTDICLRTTS